MEHVISRAGHGVRVLIVDDCQSMASIEGELLTFLGHEVRLAHNGPEALATARTFRPEVMLLDLAMPGMDGFEVAQALRAQGLDHVRLIALTGYEGEEYVRRSYEVGFDHYLVKPVDPSELVALIEGRATTITR